MGHLLNDVSHLNHEPFDLGKRLGGKSDKLFAQQHDASAQRFFQRDSQAQVADTGDRQILVQDRLTAALPYRLKGLVKRPRALMQPFGQGERRDYLRRPAKLDQVRRDQQTRLPSANRHLVRDQNQSFESFKRHDVQIHDHAFVALDSQLMAAGQLLANVMSMPYRLAAGSRIPFTACIAQGKPNLRRRK